MCSENPGKICRLCKNGNAIKQKTSDVLPHAVIRLKFPTEKDMCVCEYMDGVNHYCKKT